MKKRGKVVVGSVEATLLVGRGRAEGAIFENENENENEDEEGEGE